jgi:hypothetical protein
MLALHTRSQCRFTDFLFLLFALNSAAQTNKITAREAKDHIGEQQAVCGKVASTHFAANSKDQPTFLNLDEPCPKEVFTILIWGSDRAKFGTPETKYKGAKVCVTGKISSRREKPEITATDHFSAAKTLCNPSSQLSQESRGGCSKF